MTDDTTRPGQRRISQPFPGTGGDVHATDDADVEGHRKVVAPPDDESAGGRGRRRAAPDPDELDVEGHRISAVPDEGAGPDGLYRPGSDRGELIRKVPRDDPHGEHV